MFVFAISFNGRVSQRIPRAAGGRKERRWDSETSFCFGRSHLSLHLVSAVFRNNLLHGVKEETDNLANAVVEPCEAIRSVTAIRHAYGSRSSFE